MVCNVIFSHLYRLHHHREFGDWDRTEVDPRNTTHTFSALRCGTNYQFYIQASQSHLTNGVVLQRNAILAKLIFGFAGFIIVSSIACSGCEWLWSWWAHRNCVSQHPWDLAHTSDTFVQIRIPKCRRGEQGRTDHSQLHLNRPQLGRLVWRGVSNFKLRRRIQKDCNFFTQVSKILHYFIIGLPSCTGNSYNFNLVRFSR